MDKPEALDGLLVLDVSWGNVGGLVCSSVFSELGAEVLRIEPPEGDVSRGFTPLGIKHQGVGLGYLSKARNKRHITLNLQSPQGRRFSKHSQSMRTC